MCSDPDRVCRPNELCRAHCTPEEFSFNPDGNWCRQIHTCTFVTLHDVGLGNTWVIPHQAASLEIDNVFDRVCAVRRGGRVGGRCLVVVIPRIFISSSSSSSSSSSFSSYYY